MESTSSEDDKLDESVGVRGKLLNIFNKNLIVRLYQLSHLASPATKSCEIVFKVVRLAHRST